MPPMRSGNRRATTSAIDLAHSLRPRWLRCPRILTPLACLASLAAAISANAGPHFEHLEYGPAEPLDGSRDGWHGQLPNHPNDSVPAAPGHFERALGDTTYFGYIDASGLAIPGETWTWDHGHPTDPLEGWTVEDRTTQDTAYFRHIDASNWGAPESGNLVPAPVLAGVGSAWLGAFESEADTLCWVGGLGYGNNWNQRLESPVRFYTGSGSVNLGFTYFNDTEEGLDFTKVVLRRLPSGIEVPLNGSGFDGTLGLAPGHPATPPVGVPFAVEIPQADFGGMTQFQIVIDFTSSFFADEDGVYDTAYGPFGFDEVTISGSVAGGPFTYGFESDLQGWTPVAGTGYGAHLVLDDVSAYTILDPCTCRLEGNVIAFHDTTREHPYGQRQYAISNPVDVSSVPDPGSGERHVFARWVQYSEMPVANGVFYRPGWTYFPYTCPESGIVGWSPRVGQTNFYFIGEEPLCNTFQTHPTLGGLSGNAEQTRFIYEIYASCDAFGIPPTDCSGMTNATPILDNVTVGVVYRSTGPTVAFENGRQLIDGFSQSDFNDPFVGGNADCTRNINFGSTPPVILDDVPQVNGPLGTLDPWDARLHFRIHREGPGAFHANFASWAEWKIRTGVGIGPSASFAFGVMDTLESGGAPVPTRDRYVGYYREDDPNNPSPGTEFMEANEILVDNVPPGTRIDYFVSTYYRSSPGEIALHPDTTGGNHFDFEILPHWRDDGGVLKFPSILYIDAYARPPAPEYFIAAALDGLGYTYDIFDRLDSSCCWTAPFARGPEDVANSGMTLYQLRDYRAVLANFGTYNSAIWPEEGTLLDEWLTAEFCNAGRRGLLANGTSIAEAFGEYHPPLLGRMGASVNATSYLEATGDESFCVNLEPAAGALYGTSSSVNGAYTYGAWGSGCPGVFDFSVLSPVGTGVGNRVYESAGAGTPAPYAQVVNQNLSATHNYRTVLDGTSWHYLTEREGAGNPNCEPTAAGIIAAIENELAAALEWIFDGTVPGLTDVVCDPALSNISTDAEGAAVVTRLFANQPNPFNPRTTLRFSLSQRQEATLAVFDVSGRRVRTLVNGELEGGPHEIVWDGTDDSGRALTSGVYWSQLTTVDFRGSKKMIVLD